MSQRFKTILTAMLVTCLALSASPLLADSLTRAATFKVGSKTYDVTPYFIQFNIKQTKTEATKRAESLSQIISPNDQKTITVNDAAKVMAASQILADLSGFDVQKASQAVMTSQESAQIGAGINVAGEAVSAAAQLIMTKNLKGKLEPADLLASAADFVSVVSAAEAIGHGVALGNAMMDVALKKIDQISKFQSKINSGGYVTEDDLNMIHTLISEAQNYAVTGSTISTLASTQNERSFTEAAAIHLGGLAVAMAGASSTKATGLVKKTSKVIKPYSGKLAKGTTTLAKLLKQKDVISAIGVSTVAMNGAIDIYSAIGSGGLERKVNNIYNEFKKEAAPVSPLEDQNKLKKYQEAVVTKWTTSPRPNPGSNPSKPDPVKQGPIKPKEKEKEDPAPQAKRTVHYGFTAHAMKSTTSGATKSGWHNTLDFISYTGDNSIKPEDADSTSSDRYTSKDNFYWKGRRPDQQNTTNGQYQQFRTASDADMKNYDYLSWGDWTYTRSNGYTETNTWVAGTHQLPESHIPKRGSANYHGGVTGGVASAAGTTSLNGDANINVNFGAKTVSGSFTNLRKGSGGFFPDLTFSRGIIDDDDVKASLTGAGITSGTAHGKFFGPNAKELGGAWQADTATENAAGVFHTKK